MSDGNTEFDLNAAIDAVGAGVEGASPPEPVAPEPAAPAPEPDIPLPKAWKKEMEAYWKTAPKELREYAHLREADVSRGIQMYRDGHERWNKLLTPYQEVLQQYPDVDPVQLLNGLMQSHLRLSFGTPAEKREMVKHLLQAYQVQMDDAGSPPPAIPPELDSRLSRLEQDRAAEQRATVMRTVEAFFADPKNEFAKDVAEDILPLVQKGHSLEDAYSIAIWRNPATRAKLIAKETAGTASAAGKLNVGNDPEAQPPAPRKGTMEDTMKSIMSKHFPGVTLS